MKKCPFCAEDIQDAAIVCKHCRRDLPSAVPKTPATPATPVRQRRPVNYKILVLCVVAVVAVPIVLIASVMIVFITIGRTIGPSDKRAVAATTTPASRPSAPTPAPPVPASQESVEYKLAVLNHGGYVAPDDVMVARFSSLLEQLTLKFGETSQNVGNMSVKCRNALRDKGISESILNIMEGMNQIVDRPGSYGKDPYPNFLTLYTVLRISGKSHAFAIDNLSGVIRELGLK